MPLSHVLSQTSVCRSQHLGHNVISSLDGLAALSSQDASLVALELHGNALTALSQLAPLAGLHQLTQLRLEDPATGDK
jgi:hypothetical protein